MKGILLTLTLISLSINAQKNDSLARCGRAPYFLIVNYPENESNYLNYTYEQGGSKFTFTKNGTAKYDKKYNTFELESRKTLDNDTDKFYIILLDGLTLFVDDIYLQNFIEDYLSAKNAKIHTEINLDDYFSSISHQKYIIDRKNNVPKYNNGYCFNKLKVADIKKIQSSLAIKNILEEIKNEGIVTNIDGNKVIIESKNNADFTTDFDYFVLGKPTLRIRFENTNHNFFGIVKNMSEQNEHKIKIGDIITNIKQE